MKPKPDSKPFNGTPDYLADGWPLMVIEGMVLAGLMHPGWNTSWPDLLLTQDLFKSRLHQAIFAAIQRDWDRHGRINQTRVFLQLTALEAHRLQFWLEAGRKMKLMMPAMPLSGLCTTLHRCQEGTFPMSTTQRAERQTLHKTLKTHDTSEKRPHQHDSVSPDRQDAVFMAGWA